MPQVVLETARLRLEPLPAAAARALQAGDRGGAAALLGATLDPEWPLDDIAGNLRLQATAPPGEEPFGVWAIVEAETDTVIGEAGFEGHPNGGVLEIFYSVVPSRRRRGYATEAARALVDWAFTQPGVDQVVARCQPLNFASIGTLEKMGFHLVGEEYGLLHWCIAHPHEHEHRHWWQLGPLAPREGDT